MKVKVNKVVNDPNTLKNIKDYRLTWRFSSYFYSNRDELSNKVKYMLENDICALAIDSSMYLYKKENGQMKTHFIKTKYAHGIPNAEFSFQKEWASNPFEEHYIFELISMQAQINSNFDNLAERSSISIILDPMLVYYENLSLLLYPLIKLDDSIVIVELRIYPGDKEISQRKFVESYSDIYYKKIKALKLNQHLYNELYKCSNDKKAASETDEIEHDGIKEIVCDVKDDNITYLKDIVWKLFDSFFGAGEYWFARTTYSIDTDNPSTNMINSLLANVCSKDADFGLNLNNVRNFREFTDYKHYVAPGVSLTIGKISNTYLYADAIDDEILYQQTKLHKLQSDSYKANDENSLVNVYEQIINMKRRFLTGYFHTVSTNAIMEYICSKLKIDETIDLIKNLLELKIKKLESKESNQLNKMMLYLTLITVLLSCSPIYNYIFLPVFSKIIGISIVNLGVAIKIIAFGATAILILGVLFAVNRFVKHRK